VLCVLVFAVMVSLGTIFGVRWGNPLGVVAIILVYSLAVTAIALAFSTLVRSQGQAAGITLLLALTLAPLGGAWWPLNFVPDWMRTLAQISPIYWSQEAFSRLIYYNGTLTDILSQLGVLLLFGAVFFAFGLARFRYE
jgi:ABC-2 type transport system permease protein